MTDEIWLRIPQDRETPVQSVKRAWFGYRYAFNRSADSRASGDPGQDFLLICENEQRLVFALCDGVSQSFYGDLGARLLGEALVHWLWTQTPSSPETLAQDITSYLNSLVPSASQEVEKQPIPDHLPPMVRQVLEQKRALGSESTFVAGLFDFQRGALWLAWMGDSRLRLWGREGEITAQLGDTFRTQERWSTRRGCLGKVHTFQLPLSKLHYLIVYSDGLARLDTLMRRHFRDQSINALIEDALLRPDSDDISFFECWLGEKRPMEKPPLPSPSGIRLDIEEGLLKARWRPLAGAIRYEVRLDDGQAFDVFAPGRSCEIPKTALRPNLRSVRIRAWDEEPGEWSAALSIPMEILPVPAPPAEALPMPARPAQPAEVPSRPLSSAPSFSAVPSTAAPARQTQVASPFQGSWPIALLSGGVTFLIVLACLAALVFIPGMPFHPRFSPSATPSPTFSPFPPVEAPPLLSPIPPTPSSPPISPPSPTPTFWSTPSPTPTPISIRGCVNVRNGVIVRRAPGINSPEFDRLPDDPNDQTDCLNLDMYFHLDDPNYPFWLRIAPGQPGFEQFGGGWVAASLLTLPENWQNLIPLVTLTPTPSATPTPTLTPPSTHAPSAAPSPSPLPSATAIFTPALEMTVYPPAP